MSIEGPNQLFGRLAERIYATDSPEEVYQSVVDSAVELIDGCDHACIMMRSHGVLSTAAASDPVAAHVDRLEREVGEGPCVDAILSEAYSYDPDLRDGSPWPVLTERVLAETPVRGMIGYRLLVDGRKVGALNIFSDTPCALTSRSADEGAVLASFASMALMTVSARGQARDLRAGLETNREIGKAVGLLMAAHRVSQERAFDILVTTSQEMNMKLSLVAGRIVAGQDTQFRHAEKAVEGAPARSAKSSTAHGG